MMSAEDERKLARACAKGDPESIARLYSCYAARVYSICRRYTSNAELSRDLTHDIIIKALDKISGFKGGEVGALNSWLSRIAVNETVTYLRRHRKHIFVDCQALGDIPADDSDDERILSLPEDVISGFINELPASRRIVFNLYYVDQLPHSEIAKLLKISVGASTSTLAKARRMLAERISEYIKNNE